MRCSTKHNIVISCLIVISAGYVFFGLICKSVEYR